MSYLDHVLRAKTVLVTGATGFIGRRLAQRLAEEEDATVIGTGRRLAKAAYLKDAGVDLRQVDLADRDAMGQAMQGQSIVFHLGWAGREEGVTGDTHALNIALTESLMRQAATAGVQRVVFASSISAYGPPTQDATSEEIPVNVHQRDAYGRAKALAEIAAQDAATATGLELVITRPGMVYGPGSPNWTLNMLQLVKKGVPVIFGSGSGYANPAYIDNVVDGLLLTAVHPQATGQTFNLCDPPVNWYTFFGYYGTMCGREPRSIPLWAAKILALASETFALGLPLTRERLRYYVKQSWFPISKAAAVLGYQPRIDLETGMRQTEIWLQEKGFLSN